MSRIIINELDSNHLLDFDYTEFEFNGAITASVNTDDLEISDKDMLIAYDNSGNIRGHANPLYFPLTNEYIFMLMVYSNHNQDNLLFEFYDDDLRESYSLNQTINFESDMIIGGGFDPLEFRINNEEEISSLTISKAYPNPFNPTTNLEYSIMNSGLVKITIFDVTGRQVDVIENSYKDVGDYNVIWNAQNYTSGIYYIQILAGNEIKTQKVVLLK
jgi:hypothetical protein